MLERLCEAFSVGHFAILMILGMPSHGCFCKVQGPNDHPKTGPLPPPLLLCHKSIPPNVIEVYKL